MSGDWERRLGAAEALRATDAGDMLGKLAAFPDLLLRGREGALPAAARAADPPRRLLVGGMGGSAIAGAVLAELYATGFGAADIQSVQHYVLPPPRPGDRLLLCSYSGNTEEVLSLQDEAAARGLPVIAVSSGGRLAERLREEAGDVLLDLPAGLPPRAAFPALLARLLLVGAELGLHAAADEDLPVAARELAAVAADCAPERGPAENPAMRLALGLGERRAVFSALAPGYAAVARRLRCQMEENAERCALDRALPELHHNSWVPWAGDDSLGLPIWVGDADAHPRVRLRRELSDALLAERGQPGLDLPARGATRLSRLLTSVLLGDYMSTYHALMRGLDPTPVAPLAAMKARLAAL